MPNQVFVSYAWPLKKDHDAIKARDKFMRDLEAELGRKTPLAEHGFCFYDYGHIESGEYDYREKLRASLNNCAVGLILRDQHYMDPAKPYCFWEYQQLSKRAAKADVMPNGPKVMLIVNWDTFQANSIPREWRREHQVVNESIIGELDASTKERITNALRRVVSLGLRNVVIRVLNNNREAIDDYQDFLQVLVAFILRQRDAVEEAVNNDQLKFLEVEPYSDGLTWTRSLAAVPPGSGSTPGNKTIIYSVVAADPEQIKDSCPGREWRYEQHGFDDWKPFALNKQNPNERVHDIVRDFAYGQRHVWDMRRIHFTSHLDETICEEFKNTYREHPVVFFVDPWTVHMIEPFRAALLKLGGLTKDKMGHAAAIVVWNDKDPELTQHYLPIIESVGQTFNCSRILPRPASHREHVASVLVDEVERLCGEIRADSRPHIARPGTKKPMIVATETVS